MRDTITEHDMEVQALQQLAITMWASPGNGKYPLITILQGKNKKYVPPTIFVTCVTIIISSKYFFF